MENIMTLQAILPIIEEFLEWAAEGEWGNSGPGPAVEFVEKFYHELSEDDQDTLVEALEAAEYEDYWEDVTDRR